MRGTGRTIFKTDGELRPGQMGQSMRGTIKRERSMDMELIFGQMVLNT